MPTPTWPIGKVVFRVKYPDAAQRFPLVDTLVFIGRNLSDDDIGDTWYFQFAESYGKTGSALSSKGGDRRVVCVSTSELREMLDESGLAAEITAAASRRGSLESGR